MRHCTVCAHSARQAIDAELASGTSMAAIAKRHRSVSVDSLRRHREAHLSPALAKVALERGDVESAETAFSATVNRLEVLLGRLEGLMTMAEDRKAFTGGANVAREIRQSIELIARLTGQLDERPQTTVVNVLATPEFLAAVAAILSATERFPDARLAIADALNDLDALHDIDEFDEVHVIDALPPGR